MNAPVNALRHLLIATDFSAAADRALARAAQLARQRGARLTVLHVIPQGPLDLARRFARVTALERVNARHLVAADLGAACPAEGFGFITGDLSFISLALVLPALAPLLAPAGDLLMLVKPQFELQPGQIGKGGIVRDPALYAEVEQRIRACCKEVGLKVVGLKRIRIGSVVLGKLPPGQWRYLRSDEKF